MSECKVTLCVSIRSQPEGREIQYLHQYPQGCYCVSIRSQPEGREIRGDFWRVELPITFQSAPNPKVGRYSSTQLKSGLDLQFQSAPNPKVGRYRQSSLSYQRACESFNPLPTRRSGDTSIVPASAALVLCFNPLPTRRSGDTTG